MENNYFKLSGFDNNHDLGFSFKPPKLKFPRMKFSMPKVKVKLSKVKVNAKGIQKGITNLSKGISRGTQNLSKIGTGLEKQISSIGKGIESGANQFAQFTEDIHKQGIDTFITSPLQQIQGMVPNLMSSFGEMIPGMGQELPMEQDAMNESYGEPYQEEPEIYTDPTYGDYILDEAGNPSFLSEESNQAYYGY